MSIHFTFNNQINGEMVNLLLLNSITRKFGTNILILLNIYGKTQLVHYGSSEKQLNDDIENLKKDRIVLLNEKILIPENIFFIKPDDGKINTLIIHYKTDIQEEVRYGSQKNQFLEDLKNYQNYINPGMVVN